MGTADELYTVETVDAARLQNGEVLQLVASRSAGLQSRLIPVTVWWTEARVVDVVKDAVFRYQQCITLERTHYIDTHVPHATIQLAPKWFATTRNRFSFAFARRQQQFAVACFGWGLDLHFSSTGWLITQSNRITLDRTVGLPDGIWIRRRI